MTDRRTTRWALLCLIAILIPAALCAEPAQRQKVFILNVTVHPELRVLARDMQSRIQQEIPRDILRRRNLEFEDIAVYSDVQKWNPQDFFRSRRPDYIEKLLRDRGFRLMLVFSLSGVPGDPRSERLLLSGRLYDLDKFGCLDSMGTDPAKKDVTVCRNVESLDKIATEAVVDLDGYHDIRDGLRQLFAKLFHIPELVITNEAAKSIVLFPGQQVITDFTLAPNEVDDEDTGYWLSAGVLQKSKLPGQHAEETMPTAVLSGEKQLPGDRFTVEAALFRFQDGALREQICMNPDEVLEKLTQVGRNGELLHAGLKARPVATPLPEAVMVPRDHGFDGYGSITFRPAPAHGDYLLRLSLLAKERTGGAEQIYSYPKYRCIHVREPSPLLGMSALLMPKAGQVAPNAGGEISVVRRLPLSRLRYVLPAVSIGAVVRGHYVVPLSENGNPSAGLSFLFRSTWDLLRSGIGGFGTVNLTAIVEFGIGATTFETSSGGWVPSALFGYGGGVVFSVHGLRMGLAVLHQVRTHINYKNTPFDDVLSILPNIEIPLRRPALRK